MEKEMPIGLRFSLLHRSFKKQLDELLKEKELTGVQFGVLVQLDRLELSGQTEVCQKDLELATHVTHPTMTEIIKRLEKQGFVVCRPGAKDRRYKCICSTDKSKQLRQEMAEVDRQVFDKLCSGLSGEQKSSLIAITDIMLDNAGCCGKGKQNDD